ncbi:hypothetical protein J4G08_04375, partial [Candidatus Poribacteria bacterium]|nr:hypothetical protein [Candidatus Poribacteria bacterium]
MGDNEDEIKQGQDLTIDTAAATVVSIVTAYYTGGTSHVAYLPSIFSGWLTTKAGLTTAKRTGNRAAYLRAMSTSLSAMDTVLSDIIIAYSTYTNAYDTYLTMIVGHSGGFVRFNGNTASSVYTKLQVYSAVNPRNAQGYWDQHSALTTGWYHTWESPSQTSHSIDVHWPKKTWAFNDLSKKYLCDGGTCGVKYRTPKEAYETHREKCGSDDNVDDLARSYGYEGSGLSSMQIKQMILDDRSVAHGCGRSWYTCDSDNLAKQDEHKERDCKIEIPQSGGGTDTCGDRFRRCMGHEKDHDESRWWNGKTVHSDTPDSSSGEEGSTEEQYVAPDPAPTPTP